MYSRRRVAEDAAQAGHQYWGSDGALPGTDMFL